mgnify:FL=1
MSSNLQRLYYLLGITQVRNLLTALKREQQSCPVPILGSFAILLAIAIACLPILAQWARPSDADLDLPTMMIGVATCLALVFRVRVGIKRPQQAYDWKRALSVTHTAFALGCIPAVVIVVIFPDTLSQFAAAKSTAAHSHAPPPSLWDTLSFIAIVAIWAGITEEYIFRGLLVSTLRRWSVLKDCWFRDATAVSFSALLFGVIHMPQWGPLMGVALVGIGAGFSLAYLASGERVTVVILYHIVFDAISLSIAVL